MFNNNNSNNNNIIITFLIIVMCLISVYIWFNMPVYPDEIALRISRTRFIQDAGKVDGSSVHGLAILCKLNLTDTPILLTLPAILLSFLESNINLRIVSLFSIFIFTLSLINTVNYKIYPLILSGFIGIAGSGLILARFETSSLILLGFNIYFLNCNKKNIYIKIIFTVSAFFLMLTNIYVHPQGILFLPLTIYCIIVINTLKSKWVILLIIFCSCYLIYLSFSFHDLSCLDYQNVKKAFDEMTFNIKNHEGISFVEYSIQKFNKYTEAFIYKENYPLFYIPGVNNSANLFFTVINFFIKIILFFGLFINIFGLLVLFRFLFCNMRIINEYGIKRVKQNITFGLIAFPALFLFIYDEPQYFYRSTFICLILSLSSILMIHQIFGKRNYFILMINLFIILVFVLSLYINYRNYYYVLSEWKINSAYRENGNELISDLKHLENLCEINSANKGIIVDDLSYKYFAKHTNIYHMWYLKYISNITNLSVDYLYKKIEASIVIGSCDDMTYTGFGWPPTYKKNKICCTNLN